MALTKDTLYAAVRRLLDRTDLATTELDNTLLLIEENFDRELRPSLLEAYVELPVVDNLLPLPSDLLEIKMLIRNDDVPIFARKDASTVLLEYKDNTNRPATAFARVAGNLVFNGDVGNSVGIEYHQTVPSLMSDDSDERDRALRVLNYTPNYYLYGMAFHLGLSYGHERVMDFKEVYVQTAGAIQTHTTQSDVKGGTLIQESSYTDTGV